MARSGEMLRLASSRFPFATLAIALLCALANLEIAQIAVVAPENEVRTASALGTAAALSVAAALLLERCAWSAGLRASAAALVGVLGGIVVWFGWNGPFFVPPFVAATLLALPLAPHAWRSNGLRFWTFTLWTGFGAALGFLSVILFVLGVSAILEMVRYLFGVGLGSRSYEHIYATAMLLIGPLFALARIPRDFDEEATVGGPDRFIAGIAMLQNWVALPLTLAAAAILHLYAAKILATGEVPRNQIGWIVATYAVLVLSLRVAAAPFLTAGGAAQRGFGRIWMPALVVPLALLAYAVWLRIDAEGVTRERYYLVLAVVATASIILVQLLPPARGDIRVMVAVPVVMLAASSFGPWGVSSTVGRSQSALVASDFAAGADGRLHPGELDEGRRDVLRSRVAALAEVDALRRLDPLLTEDARSRVAATPSDTPDETVYFQALGIEYGASEPTYAAFTANRRSPFDVSGFDLVQTGLEANANGAPLDDATPDPGAAIRNGEIVLRLRGSLDRIDAALIGQRSDAATTAAGTVDAEPLVVDATTTGGRRIRLRVTSFVRVAGRPDPTNATFDVAFRAAEWTVPPPPSLGRDGQR